MSVFSSEGEVGRGEAGEARGDPEAQGRLLDFIPNAALPTVSPNLPFQSLPHHSSTKSQLQSLFDPGSPRSSTGHL